MENNNFEEQSLINESEIAAVNIKDWKEAHPYKSAIIKMDPDGINGKILVQGPARSKKLLESKKRLMYGNDNSYTVI